MLFSENIFNLNKHIKMSFLLKYLCKRIIQSTLSISLKIQSWVIGGLFVFRFVRDKKIENPKKILLIKVLHL